MGLIEKAVNATKGSRVVDTLQGFVDNISNMKSQILGYAGVAYEVASNGSTFVGMNYNSVPLIREAIRTYVKNIQDVANALNTDANVNQAIHGLAVEETRKYLAAIKEVTDAYVSSLLAYSDKMQDYYEAYSKSDEQLSSDVGSEASSLSSQASSIVYTEKK